MSVGEGDVMQAQIVRYWNAHIHDLAIASHEPGTREFFEELDAYRFEKLHYLTRLAPFEACAGQRLLEVGCGAGIDLLRFARGGAEVYGIDLSTTAIDLARKNFALAGQTVDLAVMDGEALTFAENSFDVVYAHGVLQYTGNPQRMIEELYRVLRPGGRAILMVYNRRSWLAFMSKFGAVALEHEDAPAFHLFTIESFRRLLRPFADVEIIPERFPVRTRLQTGPKAFVFNGIFVPAFDLLPRALVRRWGWHLMAFATKA